MIIRKLLLYIIIIAAFGHSCFAIDMRLINLNNVPGIEKLEDDLLFVINHEYLLHSYIPDELWAHSLSKQDLTDRLIKLSTDLEAFDETIENQDLLLLKGLICYYLFNLDQQGHYDKAVEYWERIDSYSSPDYRYKWFSGILYATSIKPFEAIDQFEYVESRVPEEKLHPFFWEDYAYASFLAFMPGRAIDCFDKFSQYEGVNLENNSLYRSLKESFVVPAPDMEIPEEELFQIFERRTGVGFLSRPMGIWIPAQREWIPQFGGYYNNFGALGFQSQGIEDEQGNSITYSIAVYFHINDDDAVSKYTSLAPNVKQVTDLDIDARYRVFEMRDPDQYKHIGGAHGYIVIYESDESDRTGDSIEEPSKISIRADGAVQYLPLQTHYLRFPGKITYVFLLDSCENIFKESKSDFVNFMQKVIIE